MKSTLFNTIKVQKPNANTFDLTHDVKFSGRMGNLMPIMAMECIPGDKVKLACDTLVRFAPLIAPVMHRMDAKIEFFFVPNRLVWANWETFIKNEATGGLPTLQVDNTWSASQQRLGDYLGLPPNTTATPKAINAIPFAAYQCIYNEWYRDQNLVADLSYQLTDGDNTGNLSVLAALRRRAFEHDYFTAALPFAQKGSAVGVPIGDITLDPDFAAGTAAGVPFFQNDAAGVNVGAIHASAGPRVSVAGGSDNQAYDPQGTLINTATTINDLRRAFRLQEWLEKMARAGSRYIELIKGHFGVTSSDARLQRPEYITGTKSPIVISEVLNTTGESAGLPQGNMAGHGVSVGNGYVGEYFCEEHGYIIGIMSVVPLPAYMDGIPKNFLKSDPLDFFWPSFANIGEQAITNDEVFGYTATGTETWGYIPRYAEYKYMQNRVAGDFRTSLDYWHLARQFTGLPGLNQAFIEVDPGDMDRIFAVTAGDDNLYIQCLNKVKARRLMPVYGTPML